MPGANTQISSEEIIFQPLAVKKDATLTGETCIGRKGKNILSLLNGQNSATPRPPFVIASRNACEAQATKQTRNIAKGFDLSCLEKGMVMAAKQAANTSEWVNPLCPHGDSYGMPNLKAITSTSGNIEKKAASKKSLIFIALHLKVTYITAGTTTWEKADAMSGSNVKLRSAKREWWGKHTPFTRKIYPR